MQQAGTPRALAAHGDLRTAQQWLKQGVNSHDPDEQLRCYDETIRLGLDCAAVYFYRGNASSDKGDLDDALRDYGEAIRRDPGDPRTYNNRGFTRYVKGDFDGALSDYEEAISAQSQ